MNRLRRLMERLRAVLAAARGHETGLVSPLPRPRVDPRIPTEVLVAEATQQGVADARSSMLNSWSFDSPEPPPYVRTLRRRTDDAIEASREQQDITRSRTRHVLEWRDEADRMMAGSRTMMQTVAVREAEIEARTILRSQERAGVDDDPGELARLNPDDTPWEGETRTLALGWRVLILFGLMAAEVPVHLYAYRYLLYADNSLAVALSVSTSIFMVLGPHVAALLLRSRRTTGGERRIGWAVAALLTPWLFVAVMLGVARGSILDADPARLERLHLTPVTLIIMFVAFMLVIGAMSFMLGLARRHPFQEAYIRNRSRRDRMDTLRRSMTERINPAFRETEDLQAEEERAIQASYGAAEEAYFASLARTVGDPSFTEAIQHRRSARPTEAPAP